MRYLPQWTWHRRWSQCQTNDGVGNSQPLSDLHGMTHKQYMDPYSTHLPMLMGWVTKQPDVTETTESAK